MTDAAKTGSSDVTYDLTSVLYHTLQGAQVYDTYIRDAEQEGRQEMATFFRDIQQQDQERAERTKALLSQCIQ